MCKMSKWEKHRSCCQAIFIEILQKEILLLSSRPNFSCLFRRLRKNGFPLAHSKTPFVLSTQICPLQRHSNSLDLWFLALLTKICLFQNRAVKILKRKFNLFKETNGALSKPVLSKRNHPFVSYVVCPITNLVKNSYFISDIIPIFFYNSAHFHCTLP